MQKRNLAFLAFLVVAVLAVGALFWAPAAAVLAEQGGGGSGTSEDHNNEGDGNKIESIHIHWVTPDSPDDSVADNLYISTDSLSELRMRYQIDVSFSGENDYEEGNICITIPAQVFHQRGTNTEKGNYGGLALSVPTYDDCKGDWYYEKDNANGVYKIINANVIPATSKAMFQFTITGIMPAEIVDESISSKLNAHVDVITTENNITIWMDSNDLTAQIDTQEKITSANKGGTLYERDPESVPDAFQAALNALPGGPEDYIYIEWAVYPNFTGNQYFSLTASDNGSADMATGAGDAENYVGAYQEVIDPETNEKSWKWVTGAIMLGAVDSNGNVKGTVENNVWSEDVVTDVSPTSSRPYRYVWTAYRYSDLPLYDTNYRFRNRVYWELTETDPEADRPAAFGTEKDPQLVTDAIGQDSLMYNKANWKYPPGRFMVFKYIETPKGHTHTTSASDGPERAIHYKEHLYDLALNKLQKLQEPVDMDYEVLTVGYGGIFTAGPLANEVSWIDVNGAVHTSSIADDYDENWDSLAWAEDPNHYLNWNYVMDTTDRWEWFDVVDGQPNTQLTTGHPGADDYEFLGVDVYAPEMFKWDKQKNPLYYFENSTYGFSPYTPDEMPSIEVYVEQAHNAGDEGGANFNSNWTLATKLTLNAGAHEYVDFAALGYTNVTGYRTRISTHEAACKLAVYPKIRLKPTAHVLGIVDRLFQESSTPSVWYRNDDMLYVELFKDVVDDSVYNAETNPSGKVHPNQAAFVSPDKYYRQYIWKDAARAQLTGAGYGVEPSKTSRFDAIINNDPANRRVIIEYTAQAREFTNLKSTQSWDQAVEMGMVKPETHGTWYDLLPPGVIPDLSTVRSTRSGDTVKSVKTYENWRDTGRMLMVVEMDLTPRLSTATVGSFTNVVTDTPTLTFKAYYDWTDINNIGAHLRNYVAFESGDKVQLGTIVNHMGEKDQMVYELNYATRVMDGEPQKIIDAMSTLDAIDNGVAVDDREGRFVYAMTDLNLNVDQMAQTEYAKRVKSDLDGIWTQGLEGQTQVNLYEGQAYTYRLRVASSKDTNTSEIVLYDSMENYIIPSGLDEDKDRTKLADYNEVQSKKDWDGDWDRQTIQVGAEGMKQPLEIGGQWRGKLVSVDMNDFIRQGCAPVVYYATGSENPWLQFGDTGGSIVDETIFFNDEGRYQMTDSTTWHRVPAEDIVNGVWTAPEGVDVSALTLDMRAKSDGTEGSFTLGSQEAAYVLVHMVAPDDQGDETQWHAKGAYAHKNEDGSASTNEDIDWQKALDPKNNMHAYNNTRMIAIQSDDNNGAFSYRTMIRNDYTRIGIMPRIILVKKEWVDDDNHDNKRPTELTVSMMRRLAGTENDWEVVVNETTNQPLTATLNEENEWATMFYQQDEVDAQGNHWEYTFVENGGQPIQYYTSSMQQVDDTHVTFRNTHENETITIEGEKQWLTSDGQALPEEAAALIPSSVTVKLYRTGASGEEKQVKTLSVTPDAEEGKWKYSFQNLDKYERGGFEYIYRVEEVPVNSFFASTQDPNILPDEYEISVNYDPDSLTEIYNFYFPFGDLQVDKTILESTEGAKGQPFKFTLNLTKKNSEGEDEPVRGQFAYTIYQVTVNEETQEETLTPITAYQAGEGEDAVTVEPTGMIGDDGTFYLRGGERIIVKKLPVDAKYRLTEEEPVGWKLTKTTKDSGTIPTANVAKAAFENTYSAIGTTAFTAKKVLTGHNMGRNRLKFELIDNNPENTETYGTVIRTAGSPKAEAERDPDDNSLVVEGTFSFAALSYRQDADGKSFYYKIREVIPEGAEDNGDGTFTYKGYVYSSQEYEVRADVTDNHDGTMTVENFYLNPETNEWMAEADYVHTLKNEYHAKGEYTFKAQKELLKREQAEGEFTFELLEATKDEDGRVVLGNVIQTKQTDADGLVTFDPIEYDELDVDKVYYYQVREKPGNDPTVIYSKRTYLYELHVFDHNDGTLTFAANGQSFGGGGGNEVLRLVLMWFYDAEGNLHNPQYTNLDFPCGMDDVMIVDYPLSDYPMYSICPSCNGSGADENGEYCKQCLSLGFIVNDPAYGVAAPYYYYYYYYGGIGEEYLFPVVPLDFGFGEISMITDPVVPFPMDDSLPGHGLFWAESNSEFVTYLEEEVYETYVQDTSNLVIAGCNFYPVEADGTVSSNFVAAGFAFLTGGTRVTGEAEIPVLTNDLEDGALDVTKEITAGSKSQPFNFHVKLTGEFAENSYVNLASEMAGQQNVRPDSAAAPYHAPEELTGSAYALYDTVDKTMVFFRSEEEYTNEQALAAGTTVTGVSHTYNLEHDCIVYAGLEDTGTAASPQFDQNVVTVTMDDPVRPRSTYYWFSLCSQMTSCDLSLLDTSETRYMSGMFYRCSKLTDLNVAALDTSRASNMDYMFYGCANLRSVDVANWDTSNATTMAYMFASTGLQSLDVSRWNTSRVTSMNNMFDNSKSLTSLDLRGWDTANVVNMYEMFDTCSALQAVNLTSFDTSSVTTFQYMFYNCNNLTELDLHSFSLGSDSVSVYSMFYGCNELKYLDISGMTRPVSTSSTGFLRYCNKLETLVLGKNFKITNSSNSIPGTSGSLRSTWYSLDEDTPPDSGIATSTLLTSGNYAGAYTRLQNKPTGLVKVTVESPTEGESPKTYYVKANEPHEFGSAFPTKGYKTVGYADSDGNVIYAGKDTGTTVIPVGTEEITLKPIMILRNQRVRVADTTNNTIDLVLYPGETLHITSIPASTAYEVWEETPKGWILLEKKDDSGVIKPLETADAVFTNEYAPNKASASLTASKIFDGKLSKKEFVFQLWAANDQFEKQTMLEQVSNTEGGVASFKTIIYDVLETADHPSDKGMHYYVICEYVDNPDPTITYDESIERVTVNITDDGAGNAESEVTYLDDHGVFENNTNPGNLRISKTIVDATAASEDSIFSIQLSAKTKDRKNLAGTFQAIRVSSDGTETDETVTFTAGKALVALNGGDTLTIKDVPAGVTYTAEEKRMPTSWAQTGAEGTSGVIQSNTDTESFNDVSFTNTYSVSGSARFDAEKLVDGELPEGTFTFELVDKNEDSDTYGQVLETVTNDPMDENETLPDPEDPENQIPNPDYGKTYIHFSAIRYNKEGTYTYVIREKAPAQDDENYDPTMIYDDREITVTVEMTDEEGEGNLVGTVSYAGGENADGNAFLNTRKDGSLRLHKTIVNATEVSESQVFTVDVEVIDKNGNPVEGEFSVVRTDSKGAETEDTVTLTAGKGAVTISAGETVQIDGLPHGAQWTTTEEETPGWAVTRAAATEEDEEAPAAPEEEPAPVETEPEAVGEGETEPTGEEGETKPEEEAGETEEKVDPTVTGTIVGDTVEDAYYENTYDAVGTVVLKARKAMDPDTLAIPEGLFSFILQNDKGSELQRVPNSEGDTGKFAPIVYKLEDVGKTFTYTIVEQRGVNRSSSVNYAFDTKAYTVQVTVQDNGDGTLKATPVYLFEDKPVDEAVFTNSTNVNIRIRKNWLADAAVKEDVRPEGVVVQLLYEGEVVATRVIAAGMATEENGDVWETMFINIPEYRDGKKAEYTIREVVPAAYAETLSTDGEYKEINNTYYETKLTLGGMKKLTGRDLQAGEYSFTIEADREGAPLPAETTVTNAADGSFTFGDITFRLSDLDFTEDGERLPDGKIVYTVREVIPEGAEPAADGGYCYKGVLYDGKSIEVPVKLHFDQESAAFTAEAEKQPDQVQFSNKYAEAEATISGVKKLTGRDLKAGEFSFSIKADREGAPLPAETTVTNAADGAVAFGPITFTLDDLDVKDGVRQNTGAVTYTVKEVIPEGAKPTADGKQYLYKGVLYDTASYDITVTLTYDAAAGKLTAKAPDGAFTFSNVAETTTFQVRKVWVGAPGGAITLTIGAVEKSQFVALKPQPMVERAGDVYTVKGLPKYNDDGEEIVYAAKEEPVPGYGLRSYENTTTEDRFALNNGVIYNTETTEIGVRKVWEGLADGQEPPEIQLTLYRDGKATTRKPSKGKNGWYYFYNLALDHDYYVVEEPVKGFTTVYGKPDDEKAAEKDRAYDGETITNVAVPKTGDSRPTGVWMALSAASALALTGVILIARRKRRNHQ